MKTFLSKINIWLFYTFFTAILFAAIIYSAILIQELRVREISRVQVFGKAMQLLQDNPMDVTPETQDLILSILEENSQLPVIISDKNKVPLLTEGTYRNIPEEIIADAEKVERYMLNMGNHYQPFEIKLANNDRQYVFYENSQLLNNLQYYPYFLGIFIVVYLFFSVWLMKAMKKKDEGFLWAGLAKETAHQIGTPLSSMIGWIEIMKLENPEGMGIKEMENDIVRLKTNSERFSKIGSIPELNDYNINETLQLNYDYLKSRISTKVNFTLNMPEEHILLPHNRILFSWVIENLTKNAVDAMKGSGILSVNLYQKNNSVYIDFKDTGCGMTSQQVRQVFNPGYSTKKRGWGLGLSLAIRVIDDYHKGSLSIPFSEVDKGTTFRIKLKA